VRARDGDRVLSLLHPDQGGVGIRRVSVVASDDWTEDSAGPAAVVVTFEDGTALIVAEADDMRVPEVNSVRTSESL
jgi:hypothetical protein